MHRMLLLRRLLLLLAHPRLVGASFHMLFEKKLWLLLPEPHVVDAFYALKDQHRIPDTTVSTGHL